MSEQWHRWTGNINYFVIALVIALFFGILFFGLTFFILDALFPSVAHFEGRDYPTMPIAQALFSFLLTIIASLFVLIVAFRKIKRKLAKRKP